MNTQQGCKELGLRQSDFEKLREVVSKRHQIKWGVLPVENKDLELEILDSEISIYAYWMFKETGFSEVNS